MEEKEAVAPIGNEMYRTELRVRKFVVTADEPEDVGGKDTGPRPGDFLRMSLASCVAITLRMYASRKNFDVKEIEVIVSSKDAEKGTIFDTQIKIIGNLDDQQKQRMLDISKRCPVHKILTNPIEIETRFSAVNY